MTQVTRWYLDEEGRLHEIVSERAPRKPAPKKWMGVRTDGSLGITCLCPKCWWAVDPYSNHIQNCKGDQDV